MIAMKNIVQKVARSLIHSLTMCTTDIRSIPYTRYDDIIYQKVLSIWQSAVSKQSRQAQTFNFQKSPH